MKEKGQLEIWGDEEGSYLVLSIQQMHADRIFEGTKDFELRKVLPTESFTRVYLYETKNVGIVGYFEVRRVIRLGLSELWDVVGNRATPRDRFNKYFGDRKQGCAIEVGRKKRFDKPISPRELRGKVSKFTAPQSYLIVRPKSRLHRALKSAAEKDAYDRSVSLRSIQSREHAAYCNLVTNEIAARYKGITQAFAKRNLVVHKAGKDVRGFLTLSKEVLTIENDEGVVVGFTTITNKIGGTVKTGPTVLLHKYRGRGYGVLTQFAIESRLRAENVSKLYCTCSDVDERVLQYLLKSGYRIEAHLDRQYHDEHGEFVMGKFIAKIPKRLPPLPNRTANSFDVRVFNGSDLLQLVAPITTMLADVGLKVGKRRCKNILERAADEKILDPEEKSVRLLLGWEKTVLVAASFLVPKRGGAFKILAVSRSNNQNSIDRLMKETIQNARSLGARRVYSTVPGRFTELFISLSRCGAHVEGALSRPYNGVEDMFVMGVNLSD